MLYEVITNIYGAGAIWQTFNAMKEVNRPEGDEAWRFYDSRNNFVQHTLYEVIRETTDEPEDDNEEVRSNNGNYYYYEDDYYYDDYEWSEREDPCTNSYYYRKTIATNVAATDLGVIAKRGENGSYFFAVNNIVTTEP